MERSRPDAPECTSTWEHVRREALGAYPQASDPDDDSPGPDDEAEVSTEFGPRARVRLVVETLVHAVLVLLSRLWGRDASLWVFGARNGEAFVDNAKYLYLEAVARDDDVRPVWLTRDRDVLERLQGAGYEAYHAYSLRGSYYSLRAGVVCVTQDLRDVNLACSGGADVAQLWHGIPLKHVGWDAEIPAHPLSVRRCLGYLQGRISAFVLTARGLTDVFESGLRIDPGRMVITGYPRTEALRRTVRGEEVGLDRTVQERLDRAAGEGPLLFYLPTFRDGDDGFRDRLDLDALERFLAAEDAHLAVKPHPKESADLGGRTGSRIVKIPSGNDVYPLLRRADVLVTDYSSVAFDFLLVDRPVAFYPFDLDRYREVRGLYFDYESVTPGPTTVEFGDLLGDLGDVLEADEFADERAALRDWMFDDPDSDQMARTYRALTSRFGPER